MLPEYVWDAGVLEGNPFTFPEVKTLLEGVPVGGRKQSDQEQILNLARSSKVLLELVRRQDFNLDWETFCVLHALVSRDDPGMDGRDAAFRVGVAALEQYAPNPLERAVAFFLFSSLHPFFASADCHTSRLMMNGTLMIEGIDAISIPAVQADEFNSTWAKFYATRDGTEMMGFVLASHPEYSRIRELNPALSLARSAPAIRYYRFDDPLPPSNRLP